MGGIAKCLDRFLIHENLVERFRRFVLGWFHRVCLTTTLSFSIGAGIVTGMDSHLNLTILVLAIRISRDW